MWVHVGFLQTWILPTRMQKTVFFSSWMGCLYIISVPCVHILSTARLTTCLHIMGNHWHPVRCAFAPGDYEITFPFNSLMHLASLLVRVQNLFWWILEWAQYILGVTLDQPHLEKKFIVYIKFDSDHQVVPGANCLLHNIYIGYEGALTFLLCIFRFNSAQNYKKISL